MGLIERGRRITRNRHLERLVIGGHAVAGGDGYAIDARVSQYGGEMNVARLRASRAHGREPGAQREGKCERVVIRVRDTQGLVGGSAPFDLHVLRLRQYWRVVRTYDAEGLLIRESAIANDHGCGYDPDSAE